MMEKSEFIKFKRIYIDTCQEIIRKDGRCKQELCHYCPFSFLNATNMPSCRANLYMQADDIHAKDEGLIENCKEYIKLYEED